MNSKKVLIVADVSWWAFAKIYRAIKKYLTDWEVGVYYINECENKEINHTDYNVVLFLCDHHYRKIKENNMPSKKVILAVRSDRKDPFYSNSYELCDTAVIVAASNEKFKKRYSKLHPNVILSPGGVDTDIFFFKKRYLKSTLRVGWAGSSKNFGEEFRGLEIIKKACDNVGFIFSPAIREERLRNEAEMVEYYHNEIDLYVDFSITAGRQNGLLEAGSCGVPIISSRAGISEDLIIDENNGFLCDRNAKSLEKCFKSIVQNYDFYSKNIRTSIVEKWSWNVHSEVFRKMFYEILELNRLIV